MTGIVTALESEAKPILELLEIQQQFEIAGKKCFKGTINQYQVCLIISDIGKVNAASATQSLISRFPEVDKVINFGVAGAVNPSLNLCDICVVEKAIQYDFDVTAIDDVPVGFIQNLKQQFLYSDKKMYGKLMSFFHKTVTAATADRFSFSAPDSEFITSLGGALRDMELGAIYQVCALNDIPAAAVKSISDTAEGNPAEEFAQNLEKATYCYQPYIERIIKELNE